MKNWRGIFVIAGFAAGTMFLSGCFPVPDYSSGQQFVFYRYNETNRPIEAVIKVNSSFAWVVPMTPDGPSVLGEYSEKTHYYYSDRRIRRRPLHFLLGQNDNQWELIVPVEATNQWIRVQGWEKHPEWTEAYKYTNRVVITVFTPRELLDRQTILTTDIPNTNNVRFLDENSIVHYKSEHDDFTYNVTLGKLEKSP
jgi:hypothetical protein